MQLVADRSNPSLHRPAPTSPLTLHLPSFLFLLPHLPPAPFLQIRPVDEVGDVVRRVLECVSNHARPHVLPPVIAADQWEAMADDVRP